MTLALRNASFELDVVPEAGGAWSRLHARMGDDWTAILRDAAAGFDIDFDPTRASWFITAPSSAR